MTDPRTPEERLEGLRIDVAPSTRHRHLAAVDAALEEQAATTTRAGVRRALRPLGRRRYRLAGPRWATALAATVLVTAPVGTAVAAEGAVPGDVLYPVKQVTERVRSVFDDDLAATHRVEELETLIDRDAAIGEVEQATDRAERAVDDIDDAAELELRLKQARERIRQRSHDGTGRVGEPGDVPERIGPTPTSLAPVQRPGGPGPTLGPGPGSGGDTSSDDGSADAGGAGGVAGGAGGIASAASVGGSGEGSGGDHDGRGNSGSGQAFGRP